MKIIALHSLNEINLKKVLEIGGFVMPSISISKYDQYPTNFGNISFILKNDSFNPNNKENIIYNKDFYSTRVPNLNYLINNKIVENIIDQVDKVIANNLSTYTFKDLDNTYINLKNNLFFKYFYLKKNFPYKIDFDLKYKEVNNQHELFLDNNLKNFFINNYNEIENKNDELLFLIKNSIQTYIQYLEKRYDKEIIDLLVYPLNEMIKNEKIDFNSKEFNSLKSSTYMTNEFKLDLEDLKNNLDRLIIEEDYIQFVEQQLKQIFHSPHFKINNKKIAYTKENIFKIMKKESLIGSESDMVFINVNSIGASYAKRLFSMKSIFEESKFLFYEKDRDSTNDLLNKKIFDVYSEMIPYFSKNSYSFSDSLFSKSMRNVNTIEELKKNLINNGFSLNMPEEIIIKAFNYLEDIKKTKTYYFEGKLKRIVDFDEFLAVVLPKNTPSSIIEKLQNKNIKIEYYSNDKERKSIYKKYSFSEVNINIKNKF